MRKKILSMAMAVMALTMVLSTPGAAFAKELPTLPTIKALDYEYLTAAEQRIFQLINDMRQNPGSYTLKDGSKVSSIHSAAPALQQKDVIQQAARYKTVYMAAYDDFNHPYTTGPYKDGEMQLYTYYWWGENIAGFSPKVSSAAECGERLFNQWLNSPGHLKNMMKPEFTYIGIGVVASPTSKYKVLGTQQFGSGDEPQLTVKIPNPLTEGGKSVAPATDNTKYGWQQSGGAWYYRLSNGNYAKGWLKEGSTWYFMDRSSGAMKVGWAQDGSSASGASRWYYMNGSGAMTTGWQKAGSKWYYMNGNGLMTTGWQRVGSKWYYMNSSGAMQTGWKQIGGSWYYMDGSGAMQTGWKQLSGKWYWLSSSGAMATGTRLIDGVTYNFDASGAMI